MNYANFVMAMLVTGGLLSIISRTVCDISADKGKKSVIPLVAYGTGNVLVLFSTVAIGMIGLSLEMDIRYVLSALMVLIVFLFDFLYNFTVHALNYIGMKLKYNCTISVIFCFIWGLWLTVR